MVSTDPGTAAVAHRPYFERVETTRLTHDHLVDLVTGMAGAVHLKGLVEPERCAQFVKSLPAADLSAFDRARYQVATFHFGPIVNHFLPAGRLTDDYWQQAEIAEQFWTAAGIDDLRGECRDRIAAAWPGRARPASVAGRDLYWGMIRENGRGAPPHWDDIVREFPGLPLDVRPISQLVFNLYLTMPEHGGETSIWPHRWRPRDDEHRAGSTWPTIEFAEDPVTVRPAPGDGMLFDPRNFHRVAPSESGRRFALAFYLGVTADGGLLTWS